jgi:hypothetical protein
MTNASRHWLTFWASLSTVIVTFGVVPTQAGIFSTTRLSRISEETFKVSTEFIPASSQASALSLAYAQSAYGVLALNETMPPYTNLNYTVTPFMAGDIAVRTGTWTANTTLYTMDVDCDKWEPEPEPDYRGQLYRNDQCEVSAGVFNNMTVGITPPWDGVKVAPWADPKNFSALYMPSFLDGDPYFGLNWGLGQTYCGNESGQHGNDPFFVGLVRNKWEESDPPNPVTALFCKPAYYEQDVEATVDARTRSPLSVVPLHPKRPLASDIFNKTVFERTVATGERQVKLRDDILPVKGLPRYLQQLYVSDLTPAMLFIGELPPMLSMALMTSTHKVEELLDPKLLAEAYQNAYRLLFVRAMTDILKTDFTSSVTMTTGRQSSQEESVILEPIFVFIVVGLLAIVSVSMLALLYVTSFSGGRTALVDDPGTHSSRQFRLLLIICRHYCWRHVISRG